MVAKVEVKVAGASLGLFGSQLSGADGAMLFTDRSSFAPDEFAFAQAVAELDPAALTWLLDTGKGVDLPSPRDGAFLQYIKVPMRKSSSNPAVGLSRSATFRCVHATSGFALGVSDGMKLPVFLEYTSKKMVGERFCLQARDGQMPAMYVAFKYESGLRVLGKIVFSLNGTLNASYMLIDPKDPSLDIARLTVHEKPDCSFCNARNVPCECGSKMYMRASIDYVPTFQTFARQPVWELFRRVLVSSPGGRSTTDICQYARNADGEMYMASRAQVRFSWHYNLRSAGSNFERPAIEARNSTNALCGLTKPVTKCPQCSATFTRNADLRRHVDGVHEGRRRFNCNHCGRAFTQRAHLKAHHKSVHERRRDWRCSVCDSAFSTKFQMERHYRAMHDASGQPEEESERTNVIGDAHCAEGGGGIGPAREAESSKPCHSSITGSTRNGASIISL